jgi:hypothetical protein
LIVVVSPLVNFPILDLREGYALVPIRNVQNRKDSVFVATKRPVTGDDAVSTAEDGVGLSLGIPESSRVWRCFRLRLQPKDG